MATVTSFEGLQHPTKSELRQFAELFTPLFTASSEEAKRQSVAALSQCPNVPPAVALFVGCQPIAIAAPFLLGSQAIDDDTLITVARTQGGAHARAIAQRPSLSPKVIDALVGLRHADRDRGAMTPAAEAHPAPSAAPVAETAAEAARLEREERLRKEIKQIARHLGRNDDDRLGLRTVSEMHAALLVRFARERDASHFAGTVADALSASRWLAERIMLDMSGHQLAVTLASLGMGSADTIFVLERFYPHLAEMRGSVSRAGLVQEALDPEECHARVEAWRRADRYTYLPPAQTQPEPTHQAEAQPSRIAPAARAAQGRSRSR